VSEWHAKDKQLIANVACEGASTSSAGPVAELNAAGPGKVTRRLGCQDYLDAVVLLAPELLVEPRTILQRRTIGDDE
jgi:hypothetical protein